MLNIAVLYIALGAYSVMWEGFYNSAKKYLFSGNNLRFFVFTDSPDIKEDNLVTVIKTKNYGWPGNTLYRFRFFLGIKDQLRKFDYVYFFNANAQFLENVDLDILPDDSGLVSDAHFHYVNRPLWKAGYERRRKSTAFVDWGCEGPAYVQACFIGATSSKMIEMCEVLSKNIDIDESNGICAVWHDESHFNAFVSKNGCKVLPPLYACPESVDLSCFGSPKILMRNKERFANLNKLRYGRQLSLFGKFRKKVLTMTKHLLSSINQCLHLPRYYKNQRKNPWKVYRLEKNIK